jgi:hypothetical protein
MVSFLYDEIGNAHLFLSLKVLFTNIYAWSFYVEFEFFATRQSLDVLTYFNCMYVFGSQNGRDKSSNPP